MSNLTFRNKDRLYAKFRQLAPVAEEELLRANRQLAEQMAQLARSLVPVRTGRLRDTIRVTLPGGITPNGQPVPAGAFAVSAGDSSTPYARIQEFGAKGHAAGGMFEGSEHPGTPAQPFFFPSYRVVRSRFRNSAVKALNRSIKKVAQK